MIGHMVGLEGRICGECRKLLVIVGFRQQNTNGMRDCRNKKICMKKVVNDYLTVTWIKLL